MACLWDGGYTVCKVVYFWKFNIDWCASLFGAPLLYLITPSSFTISLIHQTLSNAWATYSPHPRGGTLHHQSTLRPLGHWRYGGAPPRCPFREALGSLRAECGQQTASRCLGCRATCLCPGLSWSTGAWLCSLRATSQQPSLQRAGAGVCLLLTFPFTLSLVSHLI